MKNLILLILSILFISSCQREQLNELGVGYNKSLIAPPQNDLPVPGSGRLMSEENDIKNNLIGSGEKSNNKKTIVSDIIKKIDGIDISDTIRDKVDYDVGYKNDEGFLKWLLKGGSERSKATKSKQVIDPFEKSQQ